MKITLQLILILIIIISCKQKPQFADAVEKNMSKHLMNLNIKSIGKLADSTFTDSTDINSLINFKKIDIEGNITSIDMQTAVNIYSANIDNDIPTIYPIFEIKSSSNVILPVFGQGLWDKIWGNVMLDKTTMKVVKINFSHKGETPGIGANIRDSTFTKQFIGSRVELTDNTYSLYQNGKKKVDGKQRVDGMSGATITSEGAINMLNDDLMKYNKYLR